MPQKDIFILIPGSTDLNRGDQTLVWESIRSAKEAGLIDEYYLMYSGLTEEEERKQQSWQSEKKVTDSYFLSFCI